MRSATAIAHPNIALVKYWGKRNTALNLPAAGSISITLDQFRTRTRVTLDPDLGEDMFTLDGKADAPEVRRVTACLDRLRRLAGTATRMRVESDNNFPTGAGLASSASGFAALVTAAAAVLGLDVSDAERSVQARMGSGSAARSIFGGFVEMRAGTRDDGTDAFAEPLAAAEDWPLTVVVGVTSSERKRRGSTDGMELSRRTSPFYRQWLETTAQDLDAARRAIAARDFEALGVIAEHSCLKMHATMLATRPPLIYWNGTTVSALHAVHRLRADGVGVFVTIDAGPQLKALCEPQAAERVMQTLAAVPGMEQVLTVGLGGPARLTGP